MRRLANSDTILGMAVGLVGAVLLASSYRQNASVFVLPGDAPPFLVPQLLLYAMIGLSLLLVVQGLRRGGVPAGRKRWGAILGVVVVLAAATALMQTLGYLVVGPVAVFLTCLLLGYHNHLLNAAVAVGAAGLLYAMLTWLAGLPLPSVPAV